MKFYTVSLTGKMVKIGNDTNAPFYHMTEEMMKTVSKQPDGRYAMAGFANGDEVAITHETVKGALTLTGIKKIATPTTVTPVTVAPIVPKVTVAQPVTTTATPVATVKKEWTPQPSGEYGKSPAVQESIKRQACAHATTRALHAMTGQFASVDELAKAFEQLYDVIERKVSN